MPNLLVKNKEMEKKIAALENELSLVQWYLEVMEGGVDAR